MPRDGLQKIRSLSLPATFAMNTAIHACNSYLTHPKKAGYA